MKQSMIVLSLILFFVGSAAAQQPELIDRELFFGNPEYAAAQISPDGRFISFVKPLDGVRNVWVKGIDEPFEKARPLSAEKKTPLNSYFWSRDSKRIMFVKDNGGDENYNVYSVDPTAPAAAGSQVPTPVNLTNATGVRAIIFGVPKSEPDFIYIGLNDRDRAWHDLYKVQISTGTKTLLRENKDRVTYWIFDNKDQLRMAARAAVSGDTELLRVDGEKLVPVYKCGVMETCEVIRFNKDDKRVYLRSNMGDRDLMQLVLFDPATGKEEFVEEDPNKRVDFGSAIFSDVTNELVGTSYMDDKTRVLWKDKAFEKDHNRIRERLGDREVNFGSRTKDESKFIVSTSSDVDPGTIWVFDRKTKNLSTLYQVREKLPRAALSPMKPIRYKSSDGLEIPAYLTLPKGLPAKNLPLVVVPHGGPWGRDRWGYDSYAQFLANRGYAVLMPNFRASTGYGKSFLNAGNNEWGQKMQDDITWGVKYLIDQGTVDPKRVGILGVSYGGYATLAGVTFTPDVYAAAVAIAAPSNLNTLLAAIPPYWEQIRTWFHKRMGDPATPEGRAQLARQSPLSQVAKIKTPLMIVQGANDPRVKKAEADQIVIALRERNYPVQYLLADDEGHGFAKPVNNMAMFAATEKFLAAHLGGRYQESATPDILKRLKEITVDPKTVTLGTAAAPAGPAVTDISGKWNVLVKTDDRQIPVTLELKQTGSDVSGTMTSHLGPGSIQKGNHSGNAVSIVIRAELNGRPTDIQLDGKSEGGTLAGTITVPGMPAMTFSAVRTN